ncbi:hypothetical protein N5J43_23865 [Pseudomonas nicosulfuronedens]|uniref:Uncharacterized protein n=1 Tax=Pseudomonas nicosulfuronedens TaxID=2571105 RepID=A0A5R9QS67_9PSED|nr:hypothetical protein [Pseudomonas nicosulfuronedens]MDH1008470.1 hypothetical protein [Pseudomonas nicosulfuronedens]MDH1981999.1 hypothetical protein [Pseudomonas nicosulfuronedens]MDH2030399.1 hypothetical protein [Pseudomonas nicosulfuronedens]TLX72022.1 hypothetical protein FAS41_23390 [Pseudomonas nicosulfuronedens]
MRYASALIASLLLAGLLPRAANADTVDASLRDMERYLLLYSATGDERFLARLDGLGPSFEQQLSQQKNANNLQDLWKLYRQTLEQVRAAYSQKGVDLQNAVEQTQEVAGLFDTFILAREPAPQGLEDELRELALLEARRANGRLLGKESEGDAARIRDLQELIGERLAALPAGASRDSLLSRWSYLRKAEKPEGTLLYPFNAQVEYLLAHLPRS